MKRLLACLLGVALACSLSSAASAKTYVNGIDANYPPFSFVGEDGNPTGFDIEAMNWIAAKMGFEVKHQPMDWDGIIPALLAGKIDMVCSGMSISPERAAQVAFSDPYYTISKLIVVKDDSDMSAEQALNGKIRLGVQRGTNEHAYLEQMQQDRKLPFTLRPYDSPPMAIADLLNGRIDAAALDSAPVNNAIAMGRKIKSVGTFAPDDNFGVAIRKDDAELLKTVNEGYRQLKADPFWKELRDKYLSQK